MINGKTEHGDYWEGSTKNQICCDIPGVGFRSFDNRNTAVNALYLAGHKELARTVNTAFKGVQP